MSSPIIAFPSNMAGHVTEVLNGEYDIADLKFDHSPIVIDLGANVGSFTIWAMNRWKDAVVHAYEPNPGNFALLQKNVKHLPAILYNVAVSDHFGEECLYDGKHNCGESSLVDVRASRESGTIVKVISGEYLPPADIIKLDTEGSEWEIISTYTHLYGVTAIMVEWHKVEDHDRIKNFLEAQGLTCVDDRRTQFVDRGLMKFQRGVPKGVGVPAASVNLLIACPCYGGQTYATHNSSVIELNNMLLQMGVRFSLHYLPNESLIPRARNRFGTMMLQGDYTHLLFLDVDIGFNARDIISLVALDKDIAALPYSAKSIEWSKVIQAVKKGITDEDILRHCAGRPIVNINERKTFNVSEPVEFPQLGTGLLLIKRKVFEKMAAPFIPEESDLPQSRAEHNPYWCGGSRHGSQAEACWPCIEFLKDEAFARKDRKYKLMKGEMGDLKGEYAYDFFQIGINPESRHFDSEDYRYCLDARALGFETWLWPNATTTHTGNYTFFMDIPTQASLGIDINPPAEVVPAHEQPVCTPTT